MTTSIRSEATKSVIVVNGLDALTVKETGVVAAGLPGVSGTDLATVGQIPYLDSSATAWVNFSVAGVVADSYNVSSITVVSTGSFDINFTANMASIDYVITGNGEIPGSVAATMNVRSSGLTVGSAPIAFRSDTGALINPARVFAIVFGGR
jgi:hypothetical protein